MFLLILITRANIKNTNLEKIYSKLIKTIDSANTTHLHDRINELTIQEKFINKPFRDHDLYRINENIADFNFEQLEYSNDLSFATKQYSSIDLVNASRCPINTIPETPNLP